MKTMMMGVNAAQQSTAKEYFFEELLFLDKCFTDSNHYFDFVFSQLKEKGYVHDSFLTAIKQRENAYPTALPTQPCAIALPHTDIEHVVKPFISVTRLSKGMAWREMANDENSLNVTFIFLLGFIDKNGHINLLQTLMECLNDEHFIREINLSPTPAHMVNVLKSRIEL